MQTPTHTLLALALLSKSSNSDESDAAVFGDGDTAPNAKTRKRNLAIFFGSLIPDIAIYLWAPYQSIVNGVSGKEMWGELYFQAPMQNLIAWFNSVPIYALLALIGYIAWSKTWMKLLLVLALASIIHVYALLALIGFLIWAKTWGKLLLFFALAALTHMATDFPVHADDAYRHFWPISDWRYYSKFSYWDGDYHAVWVSRFESVLALGCIAILWQRFSRHIVKIVLGLLTLFYILILAAPLFFG